MFYKTVVRVFFFWFLWLLSSWLLIFFVWLFVFFAFVVSCQHAIFSPEYVLYSTTSHIHIYIHSMYTV